MGAEGAGGGGVEVFGCRGIVNYIYGYSDLSRYFLGYVICHRYFWGVSV